MAQIASETYLAQGGAVGADSVAADSIRGEAHYGIIFQPEHPAPAEARPITPVSTPWLGIVLVVLFGLFCLRIKSNFRFLGSLINELTSARIRENMFDDTVHETTFLVLLNLICAITSGILLYDLVVYCNAGLAQNPESMWGCAGVATVYCALMPAVYWIAGLVFSDKARAGIWVRGFVASQSLLGLALLLPVLVSIYYPELMQIILILALILFVLIKITFIYKSFRIFLHESSSLLLFLYYLCSVEIVPLILVYVGGVAICRLIATIV